jgi:hypothetical protein
MCEEREWWRGCGTFSAEAYLAPEPATARQTTNAQDSFIKLASSQNQESLAMRLNRALTTLSAPCVHLRLPTAKNQAFPAKKSKGPSQYSAESDSGAARSRSKDTKQGVVPETPTEF